MPIPAFLLSGKPNNDDSNEVLNDKFGYHDLGEMTSIPIPFIADGYRRFGAAGVFVFYVCNWFDVQCYFFKFASIKKGMGNTIVPHFGFICIKTISQFGAGNDIFFPLCSCEILFDSFISI